MLGVHDHRNPRQASRGRANQMRGRIVGVYDVGSKISQVPTQGSNPQEQSFAMHVQGMYGDSTRLDLRGQVSRPCEANDPDVESRAIEISQVIDQHSLQPTDLEADDHMQDANFASG